MLSALLPLWAAASPSDLAGDFAQRWDFWCESAFSARLESHPDPYPHVSIRIGNARQWVARFRQAVPVHPGQTWTFSAVAAGHRVGWLGGGAGPRLVARDASGRELPEPLAAAWDTGTFAWKGIRLTATMPAGAASLGAEFYGFGAGEYLILSASLDSNPVPARPPPSITPSAARIETELPIEPGMPRSLYAPGDTVIWRVARGAAGNAAPLGYRVTDGYGAPLDSGRTVTGAMVRFYPPGPGYFELRIEGAAPSPGARERDGGPYLRGRLGAAVIPITKTWSPGRNPFGFPDAVPEDLRRIGCTWTRPLYGNIVEGGSRRLPGDLAGYSRAWTERARQGLPAAHLNTVEIWNEPHNELEKGTWDMPRFAAMVAASRKGIRAVSPRTRIAVNWEWPDGFRAFHGAGGARLYEVACIHPYSRRIFADPEEAARSEGPEDDGLPAFLEDFRRAAPGKELWSTEIGWPTEPGRPWSTTELDQARFIVRSALIQLAGGIARVSPFKSEDVPGWGRRSGSLGLRRADLTPKPSLAAYATLARTVDARPFAGRLAAPSDGALAPWALLFGDAKGTVMALWSPTESGPIALRFPAGRAKRIGLFGEWSETVGTPWRERPGPSPVYFEIAAAPKAVAASLGWALAPARSAR